MYKGFKISIESNKALGQVIDVNDDLPNALMPWICSLPKKENKMQLGRYVFNFVTIYMYSYRVAKKPKAEVKEGGPKVEGEDEGIGDEVKPEMEPGTMVPDAGDMSSSDSEMESDDDEEAEKGKDMKDEKVKYYNFMWWKKIWKQWQDFDLKKS